MATPGSGPHLPPSSLGRLLSLPQAPASPSASKLTLSEASPRPHSSVGGRGPRGGKELEEPEKALCWGGIPLKATAEVGTDRVWGGTERRRQSPAPRGARGEVGPAGAGLGGKQNPGSQKFSFRAGSGAGPVALALRRPPSRLISQQAAWASRIPARAHLSVPLRPHTLGKQPAVVPGGRCRPPPHLRSTPGCRPVAPGCPQPRGLGAGRPSRSPAQAGVWHPGQRCRASRRRRFPSTLASR